jgi:ubiquinone/menaquinone biosynthesis C-methylase UbiE
LNTREGSNKVIALMTVTRRKRPRLAGQILEHYGKDAVERNRLDKYARLEFFRTKEIISRHLPKRRQLILDIGGGPGQYSLWLAKLGYSVRLVDPVPLHVQQAIAAFDAANCETMASASVGDARDLEFEDESAGSVLLLGPLYHLVRRVDRVKALREAHRTLKRGGLLFAAMISRFASAFDGLARGFVKDPRFFRIVQQDLKSGQHRNPTNNPLYFTTAFFHHPDELKSEMRDAGFAAPTLYGLEGPGWLVRDFERVWNDPKLRARLLEIIRSMESEPTLLGQSGHILAVTRKG